MKFLLRTMMAALALAACAPATDGPDAVVKALYAPYLVAGGTVPPALELDVYTPELKAEIDRATTYGNLLDTPIIDYDPVVGAQDYEVKNVSVAEVERTGDTARVVARFENMGTATEIPYAMRLAGTWKVDDIGVGDESLRAIINASLRPAGDPTAMEAPVRAVYDRYAAATRPVDPLQRWAPLTDDLRTRLQTATALGDRAGGADPLDFDPVVDGKGLGIGPVQYEATSSGVIVRFDKDGEPKLLVYDLVDEDGAWKIANIRAPGHWSLEQKLAEAGIQ